jgi:hypothetical protein
MLVLPCTSWTSGDIQGYVAVEVGFKCQVIAATINLSTGLPGSGPHSASFQAWWNWAVSWNPSYGYGSNLYTTQLDGTTSCSQSYYYETDYFNGYPYQRKTWTCNQSGQFCQTDVTVSYPN